MTGRPVYRTAVSLLLAVMAPLFSLVMAITAAVPVSAATVASSAAASQPPRPPAPQAQHPVPVHAVHGHPVALKAMPAYQAPPVSWPAAGTAIATVPAATAAPEQAGRLPVWVARAPARHAASATQTASAPSAVRVMMASHQAALAAGVRGVLFTMRPATVGAGRQPVRLSLSYAGFAAAYGGDYASRLHLVELPACALTTPGVPACRVQKPLPSAINPTAARLSTTVTLPAAPASQPALPTAGRTSGTQPTANGAQPTAGTVVLAATSTTSGSGGSFTATPLSEAGTWSAGGASGAFTYSYPIGVPPVPGGLAPTVSLGYNSQGVDGLTSSTQDQASWVGDGWSYSPGYIERDYKPCEQTAAKTGDLCWSANDTVTLSIGGATTTLVKDGSTGTWHAEADNGYKIQYLTGTSNGTHDGGYWKVTDPDGTSYYFGMTLPGYASGDTAANAAWTVPVYATASGQPCYNATFADSHCVQAWRWQLDYVADSHGNAMAYFYNKETNYYAADNGTKGTAAYTQGGALSQIWYGLRAGHVYGVTPGAEVKFTTSTSRTDVPTDLSCSSGASCDVQSPTFWSKYELTTIATDALKGSSLEPVDSWALAHSYPSTGDPSSPPALWLASITRTGRDGGSVSLPPVKFSGTALPNRVETQADLNDGYSIITRFRITQIQNETGGVITVNYLAPSGACSGSGSFPAPDANTLLCYPDYWTPPGASGPVLDWFNKYVVNTVTGQDTTGNSPPVQTSYSYSGAAWHYDDDSLTRSSDRTWDQWRGFRTVTTETGSAPDPVTETVDTYFQGMNGDYQSGGGTSSVSLSDSHGDTVPDSDQFAGLGFEHVVKDGAGGATVTDKVTIPWSSAATATQAQPSPLSALKAYMTGTKEADTYTALASGGTRESKTSYTFDSYGRVTQVSDVPDTSDPAQDTCTTTSYAANTSEWLLDLPARKTVVSVPCGTTASLPADAVSDAISLYDGATSLSADTPTTGEVTKTELATSYSGSTPQYTVESKSAYDEYGRALTTTDADGRTTTTAYTPSTGAEPTKKVVTDPMGLSTTTTYDPARDLPLTVTNPAGWDTTKRYDALGRLTSVWTPGHATASSAEYTFGYDVSSTAPSVVTTNVLEPAGNYLTTKTLYDALGRTRETQAETAAGDRDVTDTVYNSDGWKSLVSNAYYASGAPSGTLVAAKDSQVPSQTGYVYDGAGRVTRQVAYTFATQTWETDTSYGGNYTTVVPPAGGTATTTFTDGRGLTAAIYDYHAGAPANPSDPASDYDKTSYTYTPAKKLATITDADGNTWSYAYNLAGDRTTATTPDTGTTRTSYDDAGQVLTATDAAGKQVSYSYDADGRKVAEYDTTGGALESPSDEIASWTYDTLAKGQLTSSTAYHGGAAYTTKVIGYNGYGLSEGTETVIPSTTLAGSLAGTYIQELEYDSTGQLSKYVDSRAGGLPQETVSYGYDNAGEASGVGGIWSYVESLSYTELGQPQEYTFGPSSTPAWLADSYDQQTGRLTEAKTVTGTSANVVNDQHYSYDDAGLVTAEADTPAAGPAQVQCFSYDYLGRLVQAWAQGKSGCASVPSQSAEGGAAPYWNSYSYNTVNDLTKVVSTPASGPATTTTSTFPAAGATQPHAVSSRQSSGPSGTSITDYAYNTAGQATKIGSQDLTWYADGKLATDGSTSYVYDASGNLLLQADPGSTTLYLPGEQITENTADGALSGVRYYQLGGVTVATRTSSGSVYYLIGDTQGTNSLAVNASSLAVTRRYYDPYGNPVGAPPTSWPGDKGFVGGTTDNVTGLTNLGAREYDPATAAFISPDPLLKPQNPQDLNPYAYGYASPVTYADPTGKMPCDGDVCGSFQFLEHYAARQQAASNRGRTNPAPAAQLPPPYLWEPEAYWGAPAPAPVIRTVRAIVPHQQSTGTSCHGYYRICHLREVHRLHPGHGSFNFFHWVTHTAAPWVAHQVEHHWRGLAQIGIIGGGIICVASGVCAAIAAGALGVVGTSDVAIVGGSVLAGSAVGAGDYATSGGRHSAGGYAAATFEGGVGGLVGGGWTLAARTAGVKLGGAFIGALLLRGSAGLQAYDANMPPGDRTLRGGVNAFVLGSSRGLSVPLKAILNP